MTWNYMLDRPKKSYRQKTQEEKFKIKNYKDAKQYFETFSEITIERLWVVANLIRPELEIAYRNDLRLYDTTFFLPEKLQDKQKFILSFLTGVGKNFGFWDLLPNNHGGYPIGDRPNFPLILDNGKIQISITNPSNFYKFYKFLGIFRNETANKNKKLLPDIYYHKEAGTGLLNKRDFKLHTKIKREIFRELYTNLNKSVPRHKILTILGVYKDTELLRPERKTLDTEEINAIVKELRRNTGLNKKQLIMNNGDLTLIGRRIVLD